MNTTIKHCAFGTGAPKICLPITSTTISSVRQTLLAYREISCDVIELRIDFLSDIEDLPANMAELYALCGEKVLLVTFRTKQEGGNQDITKEDYFDLYAKLIRTHAVDILDVETCFLDEETTRKLITLAHENHIAIVTSNHDFTSTPKYEEILSRLSYMESLGTDITKIAYMPVTAEDVLTLLRATNYAVTHLSKPIISMSMGPLGLVTRISGETFGSCMTFGKTGTGSAPGQLEYHDLKTILQILHNNKE